MDLNVATTICPSPPVPERSIYEQDVIWFDRTFRPKKPRSWTDILYKDPCSYCGMYGKPSKEHIIPRSDGGTDRWDNIAAACTICNTRRDTVPLLMALVHPARLLRERWKEVNGPFNRGG